MAETEPTDYAEAYRHSISVRDDLSEQVARLTAELEQLRARNAAVFEANQQVRADRDRAQKLAAGRSAALAVERAKVQAATTILKRAEECGNGATAELVDDLLVALSGRQG